MEDVYDLQEEVRLLEPERVRITVGVFGDLLLQLDDGELRIEVKVELAFPLTVPEDFIVVRDLDGQEVGVIRRLEELDEVSRQVVAEALESSYFVPVITRVRAIEVEFRIPRWEVETNHGDQSFEISSMRADVRQLPDGRILIRDADGNRYEIQSVRKLDSASRALVEGQL